MLSVAFWQWHTCLGFTAAGLWCPGLRDGGASPWGFCAHNWAIRSRPPLHFASDATRPLARTSLAS